jgi:hypothetical protein
MPAVFNNKGVKNRGLTFTLFSEKIKQSMKTEYSNRVAEFK